MAKQKPLCRAANGLFVRNLGWKRTATGYAQHKFYLGRAPDQATLAGLRLEQLWEQVGRRWQRENPTELYPTDRPVWDEVTLAIAEAVRTGAAVARIPLPVPFAAMVPESSLLADWLHRLQADITVIKVELRDEGAHRQSQDQIRQEGERLIALGRRMLHTPSGGATLHGALDGYARWVASRYVGVDNRPTAWGGAQGRQVAFLRRHLPDGPLAELGAARVEELLEVLRLRPKGEDGRPVSVSWARNCLKQFRHFLRWLNKAPEFAWKRPADLELTPVRVPLAPHERAALARPGQVQTYTLDELRALWEHASAFQRLLLLLALNCGFGRAEVASLEVAEVLLRQPHPHEPELGLHSGAADSWVLRIRPKTGVYGEWKLWPETVAAVEWWLRQRAALPVAAGVSTLLVTRKGHRYDAPTEGNNANAQIPNSWFQLAERIRKDNPAFRRLSFNKLRKTAGNLVRAAAGGEVAGVFLCHGTPVKADELLDLYTNRPFAKVFEAIGRVGEQLRPLWAAVAEPFPDRPRPGAARVSPEVIRRIQGMARQGYRPAYIAEELGVPVGVVRQWAKRADPGQEAGSA